MPNKNVYIIAGPNGAGPRLITKEEYGKLNVVDKDLFDAIRGG